MSKRGPFLTLVAVCALAVALLGFNLFLSNSDTETSQTATSQTATSQTEPPGTTVADSPSAQAVTTTPPVPGAGPDTAPAVLTYTGDAGPVSLAITVTGTNAVAYACDGNTIESWLKGTAKDGKLELSNAAGDTLTAQRGNGQLEGTLSAGGKSWSFVAKPAQPPAGIYRYNADGTRYSWVYQAPGDVTGIAQLPDGSTQPAPPLNLDLTATIGGSNVTPEQVDGNDR